MYLNIFNEPTETIEDIIIMSNIDQILTPNLINGIEAMSIVIPMRSGLTSISTRTAFSKYLTPLKPVFKKCMPNAFFLHMHPKQK